MVVTITKDRGFYRPPRKRSKNRILEINTIPCFVLVKIALPRYLSPSP